MKELLNKITDLLNKSKGLLGKLNELKLDNKKVLLIAIISFIIIYIDFTVIIKLQYGRLKELSPKISRLKKDINNLTKDLSRLQELQRARKAGKGQALTKGAKEVISEDELLLLLQKISDLANENKVRITQVNTSKDPKAQEEVIAGERLLPVVVTFELSSGFHSLGGFLNSLEDSKQVIEVKEIKIIRNPKDYFLQNVNLSLKTYVKK